MNDSSSDSSVARTHPIVGANFESDTPYSPLPLNVPRSDLHLESVPKPDSNLESFATLAAVINQPLHHGKLQPELLPYNSVAHLHIYNTGTTEHAEFEGNIECLVFATMQILNTCI
ncbi:hypothetical protein AYI69_g10941 [Smittium culicis]|uniref:Uncharacterized protein n=1 Tax=Smittium culicis TaxID=133412 RepID=A0A1R1X2D0_9FUNG|nr:hypothetical protein AYI69_g10941 [Smittium culicis]